MSAPQALMFGNNEGVGIGDGWFDRFVHPSTGITYRPMKQRANFHLAKREGQRELVLMASAPVTAVGRQVSGRICLGSHWNAPIVFDRDGWTLRCFDVSSLAAGEYRGSLEASPCFVPDKVLHNGDHREMSLSVAAIFFR
ncbi:MAG: hypothetical protein V2A74_05185 [bacterium]